MGAFCCCPCSEELDEYIYSRNSIYGHCIYLRSFFHQLFSGNNTPFQRLEGLAVSSSIHGSIPSASTGQEPALSNSSIQGQHQNSIPRHLPYNSDPRCSRLQRDGLVSRREKFMSHFQQETQPIRRSSSTSVMETTGVAKNWCKEDSEKGCKGLPLESPEKIISTSASREGFMISPSEDEDACPTCLEEYTSENPKIVTRCSHHFHLGCIYEWLERSESCPLCGKEMEFSESP